GLAETVRSTIRAFAMIDSSPAFILRKTNDLLLRRELGADFVTAFLLVLTRETGYLRYASAGHPPPLHLGPRTCVSLEVPSFGLPLGALECDYTDAHATLALDDYLICFTDGVTEARRGGELLGIERLTEIVAALRGQSPEQMATAIREAAVEFAGTLQDDLEVLALRLC
ncbi:MAG TPA: PP2C family protein-serine/threonine phosphatase, partial [Thermoleophilia bacterium]|nr:PP2C family protein-serine/threonine phosphatase [Thermoleophilia bacterium]